MSQPSSSTLCHISFSLTGIFFFRESLLSLLAEFASLALSQRASGSTLVRELCPFTPGL